MTKHMQRRPAIAAWAVSYSFFMVLSHRLRGINDNTYLVTLIQLSSHCEHAKFHRDDFKNAYAFWMNVTWTDLDQPCRNIALRRKDECLLSCPILMSL